MPTRAEQNAALQDIGRLARALKDRLATLDKDTEWELMLQHPHFKSNYTILISDLDNRLEDFEQAADLAWRSGKRRSGPRAPTPLRRIIPELVRLYEEATGKSFTHNPKQKTKYAGTPQSPGGRFIGTFFEIVDKTVRDTSLSTAIADYVRAARAKP